MIVFFGSRSKREFAGYFGSRCPACDRDSLFGLVHETARATLYFVPIFKYSDKTKAICARCGATTKLRKESFPIVDANRIPEPVAQLLLSQMQAGETPQIPIADPRPFAEAIHMIAVGRTAPPRDPVEEAEHQEALERARASAPCPFAE